MADHEPHTWRLVRASTLQRLREQLELAAATAPVAAQRRAAEATLALAGVDTYPSPVPPERFTLVGHVHVSLLGPGDPEPLAVHPVYGEPPRDYEALLGRLELPGLRGYRPYDTVPVDLGPDEIGEAFDVGFYSGPALTPEAPKKRVLVHYRPLNQQVGTGVLRGPFLGVVTLELLDGTRYRENVYGYYSVLLSMELLGRKAWPTYGGLRLMRYREGTRTWDIELAHPVRQAGTISFDPNAEPLRDVRLLQLLDASGKRIWEGVIGDDEAVTGASFTHFLTLSSHNLRRLVSLTPLADDGPHQQWSVTFAAPGPFGDALTTLRARVAWEVR